MSKALDSIAESIGLDLYREDVDKETYMRMVIYSAASLWARSAILDRTGNDSDGTKKHAIFVCNRFYNELESSLHFSKEMKEWSNPDSRTFGYCIINNMLKGGLLEEIGHNPKNYQLSFSGSGWKISDDWIVDNSMMKFSLNETTMTGLSFLKTNSDQFDFPDYIDSKKRVEMEISSLRKMKKDNDHCLKGDLFFNPSSKSARQYEPHNYFPDDPFFIIKRENQFEESSYWIGNKNGIVRINQEMVNLREFHRLEFYLKRLHGNNKVKMTKIGKNLIKLNLFRELPSFESSLIRSVMWPCRNIEDVASFIGPSFLTNYIENILKNLGLEIDGRIE